MTVKAARDKTPGQLLLHTQVVLHRKNPWHSPRTNARCVLICLVAHQSFENDMTALDNDVNRGNRAHRITEKPVVVEDGMRHCPSDPLVAARCWKDLNFVSDFLNSIDPLYAALRYTSQKGVASITHQGYSAAVDAKCQMVEDRKLRNRNKFTS